MGFRFRKQIKILPGVKLNLSKNGLSSVSIGKAGATLNIGQNGAKVTTGIPGTGMSFAQRLTVGNAQHGNVPYEYEQQYYEQQPQQETFYFTCPSCYESLEWKFNFCIHCGADVTAEKQRIYALSVGYKECQQCHTINEATSHFCASCGFNFMQGVQDCINRYIDIIEGGDKQAVTYFALGDILEKRFDYYGAFVCYIYSYCYDDTNKEAVARIARMQKQFGYDTETVFAWINDHTPASL